ncbi:putative actin-related protein 8 [Hypsizygus marmoreus]|uniref:Actin-related protein 8 n=1 Tax=Hypsizygus marmoreus TaxID=39966 RepID=A0A369JUF8_HYPMA|nr:putative actin-related protein 8 [Hypsizygus marmoreus]
MPRGIPNARRDETGLRYTTFNVPLVANPKHMSTTYLKSESQTLWARNAKNKVTEDSSTIQEQRVQSRRGAQVVVVHLGSRFLRIGRASDVTPVTVPNVVARKCQSPVPSPARVEGISRPRPKDGSEPQEPGNDPFDDKIAAITVSLRDRMRFYKLRVTPNATTIASTFNEQFKPEIIAEYNDPYRVEWTPCTEDVYIGDQALQLADPQQSGYVVRWPIYASNFNTRDYPSLQVIFSDLEFILRKTLKDRFDLDSQDFKNYSVILVIPDFYDRAYVRDLVNLLLITMDFKQICAQQESLAATYGAGISNACVVNIGATITSVACVDEGMVLPETRMSLSIGGDDITEFLYVLLQRINFPYRDLDLARSYDWNVMEDLKSRLCTLAEGDVALNLYDFVVRRPDRPTEKYGLRAYDEIILAPMCLFEPRVIEFDKKRSGFKISPASSVTEEIIEHLADRVTNAMVISTQHLMPAGLPESPQKSGQTPVPSTSQTGTATPAEQPEGQAMLVDDATPPAPPNLATDGIEIIDVEDDSKAPTPSHQGPPSNTATNLTPPVFPGGFSIDVCFEASKLPLDVAIFNSARAAGGDEKIRKYLQAVLVIGGTAHVPGMVHALESRLQAIATPLVPNMEKVQIIPPPKEVDPRVLAWKGAAVLGKMDGVSDLWVTKSDWDILGMRGLKERCFYL